MEFLLSHSDVSTVNKVEFKDGGSDPKCVSVLLHGVPANGLVDSGADITIMGGELLKRVAAAAKLKKSKLKKADKTAKAYDQRPFTLHGRLDLSIEFDDKVMDTPVYIKMDSPDDLLLSEGVCHQLGIIRYHSEVCSVKEMSRSPAQASRVKKQEPSRVPVVKVSLVKSVHLLPHQSVVTQVVCSERGTTQLVKQLYNFLKETNM